MTSIVENRDCVEAMKEFPDKFFDLAVVDPPYGIGVFSMTFTKESTRKFGNSAAKKRDYRRIDDWDKRPTKEYFDELFRISKKQIIWGGNYFSDFLYPSKSFIVWDKRCNDAMRNQFSDCELAWCSSGLGVPRVFRYLYNGMLEQVRSKKEERFHPTQKPVALYKWIFANYASKGDKILDTHLGSGSSRIAAYDCGLDFWGYEIDKEYFDKMNERFELHTRQMSFDL